MECATKFAYSKSPMLIGNLYITKHYFCFSGSHEKEGYSVMVRLTDVKEVHKKKKSWWIFFWEFIFWHFLSGDGCLTMVR
jgi:hypothetical protein